MKNQLNTNELKRHVMAIGRLLWEKELVSGLNGNISLKVDDETILLTATKTCLGLLKESDIFLMKLDGTMLEDGKVSIEKALHMEIYKNFPDANAVIHSHTNYTNGYFLSNDVFEPKIFEAKLYLGQIKSIEQNTPNVSDIVPVIEELKGNNIVALRKHGILAMGKELFDCFLLIQALEDAIKVDVVNRIYGQAQVTSHTSQENGPEEISDKPLAKKYKLFSKEQINEIVRLVNCDAKLQELGKKSAMTMTLAVKLTEENIIFSFKFVDGKIVDVGRDDNVEFVITAPEKIWRAVFNRDIDPFVATTQKKMNLSGDFARISKWYAPCSRLFELWAQVPVE